VPESRVRREGPDPDALVAAAKLRQQQADERLRAAWARQEAQDRKWRWATVIGAGLLLAGCVAYRNGAFQDPEPPAPTLPPIDCAHEPAKDTVNERGEPDFQWGRWHLQCVEIPNSIPDDLPPPDYGDGGFYDPEPDLGCPAGPRTC
jgi:hypothetical protein